MRGFRSTMPLVAILVASSAAVAAAATDHDPFAGILGKHAVYSDPSPTQVDARAKAPCVCLDDTTQYGYLAFRFDAALGGVQPRCIVRVFGVDDSFANGRKCASHLTLGE